MKMADRTSVSPDFSPAERIGKVREYYFSVKLKEIAALNAAGKDIINLGIGSPDLPPSEATVKALCDCALRKDSHGYQPYVGLPELRAAFAGFYKRKYRVDLDPEKEILPLMGSKEGIMHVSMAFVNKGDGVLVPDPGYPTYTSVSELVGADIIKYDLLENKNWYPDFESLEKMHKDGTINLGKVKLMWCNYPNMPTGASADMSLFERLVSFGRKYGIIICHDNPYSFILNDNPISILEVEGAKENCIELNSTSKTFNMPGWRVGMLASNQRFIEWILRVKSNMDSGMFRGLQLAAIEALSAPESWYESMNRIYSERKSLATRILESAGCEVSPGQQGLFLWGKIKGAAAGEECASKVRCDEILYGCGVFLAPGMIFGRNGNNYMRISLCADSVKLGKALERVEKLKNI